MPKSTTTEDPAATTITPDRIEKRTLLRAPRTRVWQALTEAEQFGRWFRVNLDGKKFVPGAVVSASVLEKGYEHITWQVTVEQMVLERLFSFRWHPYAIEPGVDYSAEPMTLVEFRLEDAPEGTWLTVSESGFHAIPAGRRAEAFRMNDGGWTAQADRIARYVEQAD